MTWRIGHLHRPGWLARETQAETVGRLVQAARPVYGIVGPAASANGNAATGAPGTVTDGSVIAIAAPAPVSPAPVSLPVRVTAAVLAIKAQGRAALGAARLGIDEERTRLRRRLARELARLLTCRWRTVHAQKLLTEALTARTEFLGRLSPEQARLIGRRVSRAVQLVPWALWLADTWIIARAWGLLGPAPVPFTSPSVGLTQFTSLARAGLVSYALIFGAGLVSGQLRGTVERLRARLPLVAGLVDLGIVLLVLGWALRLAVSTATMQAVLLEVESGGSNVSVPRSVLFSIVAFLITVSVACGYFLHEPERDQAHAHDKTVKTLGSGLETAVAAENTQRGKVWELRQQLHGLVRQEQLLTTEQDAHTDHTVYVHKQNNPYMYGLELPDPTAAKPDGRGKPGASGDA